MDLRATMTLRPALRIPSLANSERWQCLELSLLAVKAFLLDITIEQNFKLILEDIAITI